MSNDELNRKMEFIVEQQAIFSSDMIELKSRMDQTSATVNRLSDTVERLSDTAERQGENIERLAEIVQRQAEEAEINRQEMRQAIENLIIGNEVTRDLANRAAELAINVSRRMSDHQQEGHK